MYLPNDFVKYNVLNEALAEVDIMDDQILTGIPLGHACSHKYFSFTHAVADMVDNNNPYHNKNVLNDTSIERAISISI